MAAHSHPVPTSRAGRIRWTCRYAVTLAGWALGRRGSPPRRRLARVRSSRLFALGELYYVGEQFDRMPVIGFGSYVEGKLSADPATAGSMEVAAAGACVAAGRMRLAQRFANRALARAEQPGVPPEVAGTICLYSVVVWSAAGTWDELFRSGAHAVAQCRTAALHRDADQALLLQSVARYHLGEYAEAMRIADGVATDAQQRGSTATLLWSHLVWAEAALRAGRLAEAGDRAQEATRLAERVEQRIDRIRATVVLARLALAADRLAEVERLLVNAAHALGNRPTQTAYTLEAHAGVPELALDLVERGYDDRRGYEPLVRAGLRTLATYARGANRRPAAVAAQGPAGRQPRPPPHRAPRLRPRAPGGAAARDAVGAGRGPSPDGLAQLTRGVIWVGRLRAAGAWPGSTTVPPGAARWC